MRLSYFLASLTIVLAVAGCGSSDEVHVTQTENSAYAARDESSNSESDCWGNRTYEGGLTVEGKSARSPAEAIEQARQQAEEEMQKPLEDRRRAAERQHEGYARARANAYVHVKETNSRSDTSIWTWTAGNTVKAEVVVQKVPHGDWRVFHENYVIPGSVCEGARERHGSRSFHDLPSYTVPGTWDGADLRVRIRSSVTDTSGNLTYVKIGHARVRDQS